MKYSVEFSDHAAKQIRKLDKYTQSIIYSWLNKRLEGTENPYSSGRALTGEVKGLWRYRIGDYRLICTIENAKLIILVLEIGHQFKIHNR